MTAPVDPAELRRRAKAQLTAQGGEDGESRLVEELKTHQLELEMQKADLVEARLEAERAAVRATALFDSAPIAYAALDTGGAVLSINVEGVALLALDRARIIGGRFGFFVSPRDRAVFNTFIADVLQRGPGARSHCELALERDGGDLLDARLTATVLEGATPEILIALEDISEQREAEELRARNAELREWDRRRNDFLAMLSHELRSPLAPIRNSSYILRHAGAGSEQARRAQDVIERQTEHLARLVDDLLDVTRIARGKIELHRSPVDLREVVARAAEDFRVLMHDRGIRFEVTTPREELWADADATRITQVIGNLLHNASKFTRGGGEVALSLEPDAGNAVIRVRDTGAGIDPELLPRIFAHFVQGERTLARTEGGLGLGLALVKGITELHGGTVRAESAGEGKGSEFTFCLPALSAPQVKTRAGARPARRSGGRRVLVVDDNHDAAESLADLVRMLGHGAEVAHDGPTAVEKVRASQPDVVLCDVGLPGMSGYAVAKELRGQSGHGIQLIAVSGYAQPEDVRRAMEAGFDGHIAKPCDPEEIERLLSCD